MSPLLSALIVAAGAVIVNAVLIAFTYGKLVNAVDGNARWLASVATDVKGHETRISHIEGAAVNKPNGKIHV